MALTELQLPAKADLYSNIKTAATEMDNLILRWGNFAEALARMDASDLTAMTVPTGQVRTDLVEFRLVMQEMVAFYNGTSTARTNTPADVVDKLRSVR